MVSILAKKLGFISYTLATMASLCFISGLLVLTGGEHNDRHGDTYINYWWYASHKT